MKWKGPELTERGFTGVYDAAGHKADVIALLQGGKTGEELVDGKTWTSPYRKLSSNDVRTIRALVAATGNWRGIYQQLARRFGVDAATIWQIVNGYTYKEVA